MFLIQYTGFPHATIIRIENIARLVYAPLKKEGTKAAFMALFGLQKNFAVRDFFHKISRHSEIRRDVEKSKTNSFLSPLSSIHFKFGEVLSGSETQKLETKIFVGNVKNVRI